VRCAGLSPVTATSFLKASPIGSACSGDLRGREATLDEQLPREFILGREDVVKLRAEFALNRPADQDGAWENPIHMPSCPAARCCRGTR